MNKKLITHNHYNHYSAQKRHLLQFGTFGFKVMSFSRISENQIEVISWLIQKKLKKISGKNNFKFWFLIYPNLYLTKLSLEARMGKGKGPFNTYAFFIKAGTILCEFDNLSLSEIKKVFKFINKKFPGKLKLINNTYKPV